LIHTVFDDICNGPRATDHSGLLT